MVAAARATPVPALVQWLLFAITLMSNYQFCAGNINNWPVTDAEVLGRADLIQEASLIPGSSDVTYAPQFEFSFFSEDSQIKDAADPREDTGYLAIAQRSIPRTEALVGLPGCTHVREALPSGRRICLAQGSLSTCTSRSSTSACPAGLCPCMEEVGDKYCRSHGYDGMADMLSANDLFTAFQIFKDAVDNISPAPFHVVKLKLFNSNNAQLRWCRGICADSSPNSAVNVVMTNLTVISMGAVDDTVGFYYSGGTEGLTATAELAPMCVKSGLPHRDAAGPLPTSQLRMTTQVTADGTLLAVPTNTNKGPGSNYFLAGWPLWSQMNEMTESWLSFPRFADVMRRPLVEFHHSCGTAVTVADARENCQLDVIKVEGISASSSTTPLHQVTSLFNDGSVQTRDVWMYELAQLPAMGMHDRVEVRGLFHAVHGALGLDNLRLASKRKCISRRWIEVPRVKLNPGVALDISILDSINLSGVTIEQMEERFELAEASNVDLHECSLLCQSGTACDVFFYSPSTGVCQFFPHRALKSKLLRTFTEPLDSGEDWAAHFLICSSPAENVLPLADGLPVGVGPDWTVSIAPEASRWRPPNPEEERRMKHIALGGHGRNGLTVFTVSAGQSLTVEAPVLLPSIVSAGYLSSVQLAAILQTYARSSTPGPHVIDLSLVEAGTSVVESATDSSFSADAYPGYFALAIDNAAILNSATLTARLTFTAVGATSEVSVAPIELLVDMPLEVGCFEVVDDPSGGLGGSSVVQLDPMSCLHHCLSSSLGRFAFVRRAGAECVCLDDDFPSADVIGLVPDSDCTDLCPNDAGSLCGGADAYSVYVATCPNGEKRFGDHCYVEAQSYDTNIKENEDQCMEKGSHLWFPESGEETVFVTHSFAPSRLFHVGYRYVHKRQGGVIHADYSHGVGLQGFTAAVPGGAPTLPDDEDYLGGAGAGGTGCVVWDLDSTQDTLEVIAACPDARGVCKAPLARVLGSQPLCGRLVPAPDLFSAPAPMGMTTPSAWPVSLTLLYNPLLSSESSNFILVETKSAVMITGVDLSTDRDRYLRQFGVAYVPWTVLKPTDFKELPPGGMHFRLFEGPASDQVSQQIRRKIFFPYPVKTTALRINLEEAMPQVDLTIDLLGMTGEEQYKMNPYMDEKKVTYEMTTSDLLAKSSWEGLKEKELLPGGSIYVKFTTSQNETFSLTLFDTPTQNRMVYTMSLDEANRVFMATVTNDIGKVSSPVSFWLPKTVQEGLPTETEIKLRANGFHLYVDGDKMLEFRDVVHNNIFPIIDKIFVDGGAKLLALAVTGVHQRGLIKDLGFEIQNQMNPDLYNFMSKIWSGQVLIDSANDLVYQTFHGENSYGFIPFQTKQHCYTSSSGARCLPAASGFKADSNVTPAEDDTIGRGHGGGELAANIDKCISGYTYLGRVCVRLGRSGEVPAMVTVEEAIISCSSTGVRGDVVYYPVSGDNMQNVIFREAMNKRFEHFPNQTIWIGLRFQDGQWHWSNGAPMRHSATDWAPGQPNELQGNCVVADKALGFRWRTALCTEIHAFFCAFRYANCPQGYEYKTWVSPTNGFESEKCFKLNPVGGLIEGAQIHHSVHSADELCRSEGSRLFVPQTMHEARMVADLLWEVGRDYVSDPTSINLWSGLQRVDDFAVIVSNEFSPRTDLSLETWTVGKDCLTVDPSSGFELLTTACWSSEPLPPASKDLVGVCQYEECRTVDLNLCAFPFKYKGRLYDTCVMLNHHSPWCSTTNDNEGNYVGLWQECLPSCKVSNCPVGFYRNYPDQTCYKFSSIFPTSQVSSVSAASAECRSLGARLWEPRTVSSLSTLTRAHPVHFWFTNNGHTAMGIKRVGTGAAANLYYSSAAPNGFPLPKEIAALLEWVPGYPIDVPGTEETCLVAVQGQPDGLLDNGSGGLKVINVECNGGGFVVDGLLTTEKHLGYICEARPMSDGENSCHLPFIKDGTTYDGCTTDQYHDVDSEGDSWCASSVDTTSGEMTDWVRCPLNEWAVVLQGGAEGDYCNLPFYMSGQYYETCTRHDKNRDKQDWFWCPSENSLDPVTYEWLGDFDQPETFGICPNSMFPPDNGCKDHYEPVGEYCYRVSPHRLSYADALSESLAEGSHLAHIASLKVQKGLMHLIKTKQRKLPEAFFEGQEVHHFWIGGALAETGEWVWEGGLDQPMTVYESWKSDRVGYGCPNDGCDPDEHAMYLQAVTTFDWKVGERTAEKSFISVDQCKMGYLFYPRLNRCLRVVHEQQRYRTLPEAMTDCARFSGGRLYYPASCSELDDLRQDLLDVLEIPAGAELFTGVFGLGLSRATERRRSTTADQEINAYGYATSLVAASNGLCGQSVMGSPTDPGQHVFTFSVHDTNVETGFVAVETQLDQTRGYVCQMDDRWGCPNGYYRLTEDCIKIVRVARNRFDAQMKCNEEGAKLARPQTLVDLEHLYQVISEDESELMNKGVFPGDDLPRFWLGFYQPADFGTVQPFDTFGAAETVQGCACTGGIQAPSGAVVSRGKCYAKNFYPRSFFDAGDTCTRQNMQLARLDEEDDYLAVTDFIAGSDRMWLGVTNPTGTVCTDAADCDGDFSYIDDGSPVNDQVWLTGGMENTDAAFTCVHMEGGGSNKLQGSPCDGDGFTLPSLCQYDCNVDDDAPRHAIALQRSSDEDAKQFVEAVCAEENFYICQKDQSLVEDLEPYFPQPVAVLPLSKALGTMEIANELAVHEENIGYSDTITAVNLLGSALTSGGNSFPESHIELVLDDHDSFDKYRTSALMWIKTADLVGVRTLLDFHHRYDHLWHASTLDLKDGYPMLRLFDKDDNTIEVEGLQTYAISDEEWHFVAFSYNATRASGFLVLDEKVHHFSLDLSVSPSLLSPDRDDLRPLIGANRHQRDQSIAAAFSCVQLYDSYLTEAHIKDLMHCGVASSYKEPSGKCPPHFSYFEGVCYLATLETDTYRGAEVGCLHDEEEYDEYAHDYVRRLAFSTQGQHLDFMARLVLETHEVTKFWVGMDARHQGSGWKTSYPELGEIASADISWRDGSPGAEECVTVEGLNGGLLVTEECDQQHPYVCSQIPLDRPPDNSCPRGQVAYRGKCLSHGGQVKLSYEGAQEACAETGGILVAPRDAAFLDFIQEYAGARVQREVWVGVQKLRRENEVDLSLSQSLKPRLLEEWTYSDVSPFDPASDFAFGADRYNLYDCVYLKRNERFKARITSCQKKYSYICEWKVLSCPAGYEWLNGASDGRACYGLLGPSALADDMCSGGSADALRRPFLPVTRKQVHQLTQMLSSSDAWLGAVVTSGGNLEISYDREGVNDPYMLVGETEPVSFLEHSHGTLTFSEYFDQEVALGMEDRTIEGGCLAITKNGLIQVILEQDQCETMNKQPVCEYRACLTKHGERCIFPFTYKGTEYRSCSSQDIFKSWCPTDLDGSTGEILAWDECLDDCPHEEPQIVCQEEPDFPQLAYGFNDEVNFTTLYEQGEGIVVRELDYVAFDCPEGYVFRGTFNVTVYAICINWKWEYTYSPDMTCVPVLCPCPRWFPNNTLEGTYDWDPLQVQPECAEDDERPRYYRKEINYKCPTGFVFDVSGVYPPLAEEPNELTLTCETYSDWYPPIDPLCIPASCRDDPFQVGNNDYGWYDWDETIRNKSYTFEVNYWCPRDEWGFPSSGMKNLSITCLENREWSLKEVETCQLLPCPSAPPPAPDGGHRWYRPEVTKYSCPETMMFPHGRLILKVECTAAGKWSPQELPECVPLTCTEDPPDPELLMERDWPLKRLDVGATVRYDCPLFRVTWEARLQRQWSSCIYDDDRDEAIWFPSTIHSCNPGSKNHRPTPPDLRFSKF